MAYGEDDFPNDEDYEKFKAFFAPAFDTVESDVVKFYLADCIKECANFIGGQTIVDTTTIPGRYIFKYISWRDEALYNLVAHSLIINQSFSFGINTPLENGNIATRVGDLQETKGVRVVEKLYDSPYLRTPYGQRFLYIQRRQAIALSIGVT